MNLEKLAREIAMCKSPNVDKWLVPIVDLEQMISLIQRQESELAASRDENETIKAASAAPLVMVDTLTRWSYNPTRGTFRHAFGSFVEFDDAIAHTARAVAAAVEKERASEMDTIRDRDQYHEWADKLADAIAKYFGRDIGEHSNVNCPWAEALDVIEEAEPFAAQPVQQPAAVGEAEPVYWSVTYNGQHTANVFRTQALAQACIDKLNAVHPDDARSIVPLYAADVPAAGVQGDKWRGCIAQIVVDTPLPEGNDKYQSGFVDAKESILSRLREAGYLTATVQPDSGRDAALEEAAKICDAERNGNSNYAGHCADAIRRLKSAAHSAPSSDAALVVATSVEDNHINVIATINRSDGVSVVVYQKRHTLNGETIGTAKLPTDLAAHPANGAQAGLSDA